jgi:hypothetical protein
LGTEIADAFLFGSSRLPLRATTKLSIMEWPLQLQCIGVSAVRSKTASVIDSQFETLGPSQEPSFSINLID